MRTGGLIRDRLPGADAWRAVAAGAGQHPLPDRGHSRDGLASVELLGAWLTRVRSQLRIPLADEDLITISEAHLSAARELRDCIHSLAATSAGALDPTPVPSTGSTGISARAAVDRTALGHPAACPAVLPRRADHRHDRRDRGGHRRIVLRPARPAHPALRVNELHPVLRQRSRPPRMVFHRLRKPRPRHPPLSTPTTPRKRSPPDRRPEH